MFYRLGHFLVRRRKAVLAGFIIAVIAMGATGSLIFARLDSGGYSNPKSESAKAAKYLTDTFKIKDPAIVFAIDAGRSVKDPTVAMEVVRIESELRAEKEV